MIFIQPMAGINLMTDPEGLTERWPQYTERFDAIAEHRDLHQAYNESRAGQSAAFRSIASLCLPIERALALVNGGIKEKSAFYRWLNANPAYCVYDIRKSQADTSRPHTYIGGKPA